MLSKYHIYQVIHLIQILFKHHSDKSRSLNYDQNLTKNIIANRKMNLDILYDSVQLMELNGNEYSLIYMHIVLMHSTLLNLK